MPAVRVCSSPLVPAEHAWEIVGELQGAALTWSTIPELIGAFAVYVAAYLFGLLVFIICLRGWRFRHASEKNLGISVAVLVGSLSIPLALYSLAHLIVEGFPGWDPWFIFLAVLGIVSPLYFLRSIRMRAAGLLCLRWYAAVCGLAWFSPWLADGGFDDTYYGLWLSMGALVLILVSTHAEARIRTRCSRKRTFWNLLRCRLELYDLDGPRCFGCGYLLVGLPSHRCPECGLEFDPLEYGLPSEAEAIASAQNSTPGQGCV